MNWLKRWWVEREPIDKRIRREAMDRLRCPVKGTREWRRLHNYADETPWLIYPPLPEKRR